MSISRAENITINGSQRFLGGVIYSARFERGFNGQPSTIEASIVAESANYQIPELSYTSPYHISFGDVYHFDFFATSYCISDGQQGKTLTVSFEDETNKLRRWWVAPVGHVCYHPNVIFLGIDPTVSQFGAVNQAQGVKQTTSFTSNPTSAFQGESQDSTAPFVSYNYSDFQRATSFLGIPIIPSNNLVRITHEGTVMDIFNYFMNLYGYTWYFDNGLIKVMDLKRPITIDQSLIDSMEAHSKCLSSNLCVNIKNNYVRGAVALEDGRNEDADDPNSGGAIVSAARAIWDGTEATPPSILGVPLLAGYGPIAALYAAHSPQLYFAYLCSKYDEKTALQAMGFISYTETQLTNAPRSLYKNQAGDSSSPFNSNTAKNVKLYVCSSQSDNSIQSFYEKDKALGEVLLQGYYLVQDTNSSVQWNVGSPKILNLNTRLSELSEFGGLIFDDRTLGQLTSRNTWLLSFPTKINFQMTDTFFAQISSLHPVDLPFPAKLFGSEFEDAIYKIVRVNTQYLDVLRNNLPKPEFPNSAIRYVYGSLSFTDLRLGQVSQKDIPIYGLAGRRIIACNIPPVQPETSNLEIVTFENIEDSVPNVQAFIAQNTFSKNSPDVEFEWNIRGIAHEGITLTPEQGLDSISISLAENGYNTSYHLSSKREVPPNPDSLTGPKQFSTLT